MDCQTKDSERLSRLLACKRYEQPPPGYFNRFPDRVLARIEAECLSEPSTWWGWLLEKLEAKPIMACAYGMTVSTLLLGGFQLSNAFESEAALAPDSQGPWLATAPVPLAFSAALRSTAMFDHTMPGDATSLSAAFRPEVSNPFFKTANARFQTIGYTLGH